MPDLSQITSGLSVVVILYVFAQGGGRWLPVRKPVLRVMQTTLLAASLIALAVKTFVLLAPGAAMALNPAWYLAELAVVVLLVGVAGGAWITDRRLGPPQA